MGAPLAYFLTWTTYGSWLPGDDRGWVEDAHNRHGEPYREGDGAVRDGVQRTLADRPLVLDGTDREMVDRVIREHCERRRWPVLAINVRTNHVHLVVQAADFRPELVVGQLKSWATRRLKESGRHDRREKFWTNQASTRYLFTQDSVARAIAYTRDQ